MFFLLILFISNFRHTQSSRRLLWSLWDYFDTEKRLLRQTSPSIWARWCKASQRRQSLSWVGTCIDPHLWWNGRMCRWWSSKCLKQSTSCYCWEHCVPFQAGGVSFLALALALALSGPFTSQFSPLNWQKNNSFSCFSSVHYFFCQLNESCWLSGIMWGAMRVVLVPLVLSSSDIAFPIISSVTLF